MPEGDTIWRTAAALRERVEGRTVKDVRPQGLDRLRGRVLEAVEPRGKHLLMRFSGGWTLHSHMRMTGSWHLYHPGERWRRPDRFAKAVLDFDQWLAVCFSAPVLEVLRDESTSVGHLGPDVLGQDFPLEAVVARARSVGPRPLGELLLDQRVCCGVGNVYKCESLWQTRLDPWRSSAEVDDGELARLFDTARTLMRRNISPGSTFGRRFPGSGRAAVHGRRGRPCPRCGALVRSRQQGEQARWTYWCPSCQSEATDR
ncbi:DNA-formamidopyrimidine glycosylase family protein [Candidatus Nephthysia bennettiae]|uniref:DNA-(apurinic or apyrimidinic site) lyase n=1 Tax=Candidatus Nephthysia bennettiae TaxID=3127016 RepID=A0A934K4L1_9BACT|nr:Fpg/Nei family DNA glycosylase [Candidatus Dormibacteraeota bacterium]MBJ7614930.1 Fpg/Nei family DNA glycosylase [Candidatus Dormibacteraeota bacterium]